MANPQTPKVPAPNPFSVGQDFFSSSNWQGMYQFCLNSGNAQAIAWAQGSEADLQKAFNGLAEHVTTLTSQVNGLREDMSELRKLCRENSEALREAVERIEGDLSRERKMRHRAECLTLATTIMARGIPLHTAANNENRPEEVSETRVMVFQALTSLGLNPTNAGVREVNRLKQRQITLKDGRKVTTDTVKIRFDTFNQKLELFKALALKGKDNPAIKVADAIPYDLVGRKKFLDTLAADYRKAHTGSKTRTVCRSGEMIIVVKAAGEKKFVKKDVDKIREELGLITEEEEEDDSSSEIEQSPQDVRGKKSKRKMLKKTSSKENKIICVLSGI